MTSIEGIFSFIDSLTPEQNIKVGEIVEEARADEREKVLSEVEGWLVDEEYPITDPDSIDYGKMLEHPWNEYRAELRTKLNQLKENV